MKLIFTLALLCVFAFTVQSVTGIPTVSIDCGALGIPGHKTKIKCTISEIHQTGLRWFRPRELKPVILCNADNTNCDTDGSFTGLYRGYVEQRLQSVLEIESFDPELDAGEWACRFGYNGALKSVCKKQELKTATDCLRPAVTSEKTELTCKLSHTYLGTLCWLRPLDELKVVRCNMNTTECTTYERVLGKYNGFVATPLLNTLIIDSFDPKFDAGKWTCGFNLNGDGFTSSCNKQEATTTIDCMQAGIAGQRTELKCTLSHVHHSGLRWIRPRGGKEVVVCNINNTVCTTAEGKFEKYRSIIVKPLQNSLIIEAFDPKVDGGEWSCAFDLWQNNPRRTRCNKAEAKTTIDCMQPGIAGHRTEIKCKLSHKYKTGLHWYRPRENRSVVTCNKQNTDCISLEIKNKRYTGVIDAYLQNTLIIEPFEPQVDAGEWACGFGRMEAAKSVCSKIEALSLNSAGSRDHIALTSIVISWCTVLFV